MKKGMIKSNTHFVQNAKIQSSQTCLLSSKNTKNNQN